MAPCKHIQVAQIQKFRESGGLGISLEGTVDIEEGREVRPHHYIRAILPEGPVGIEGSLKPGDEILQVNGTELINMNHMEVVGLLKDLPVDVEMVCARLKMPLNGSSFVTPAADVRIPPEKTKRSINRVNSHNNKREDVRMSDGRNQRGLVDHHYQHQEDEGMRGQKREMVSDSSHSVIDRLVKAKSDGSLSIAGTSSGFSSYHPLSEDASRIRCRSLEPLTGLAMWSSEPQLIQLIKGERGLGFSILDYQVWVVLSYWMKHECQECVTSTRHMMNCWMIMLSDDVCLDSWSSILQITFVTKVLLPPPIHLCQMFERRTNLFSLISTFFCFSSSSLFSFLFRSECLKQKKFFFVVAS